MAKIGEFGRVDQRAFTSFLLTRLDVCIIFEAENGQVCIDKMRQAVKLPSVIILDIEMPVMDGFETALQLKKDWPSLTIIAFSSKNDADSMQRILAGGADFFLTKEADITQPLIQILEQIGE